MMDIIMYMYTVYFEGKYFHGFDFKLFIVRETAHAVGQYANIFPSKYRCCTE